MKQLIHKLHEFLNFHKDFSVGISSAIKDGKFVLHDNEQDKYFVIKVEEVEPPFVSDFEDKDGDPICTRIFKLLSNLSMEE